MEDSARAAISHLSDQENSQFLFLAEVIPQLVWITDLEGYHTYFNQHWIDFTGYDVEASKGTEMWNNLLHPDDRQRARDRWNRSLRTGEFYEIEYRFLSKEGGYRWFLGQALPQRDAAGTIVRWFGTCTDIQEQKEKEEQLRQREQELTTLANAIPQMAWMVEPSGYIFWYNERWYDYTGTTLEQMRGWGWQAAMHPNYVDGITERLNRAFETEEPWQDTYPIRSKTGDYRWFLSRAVPLRDENGKVLRWFGTNTDVTEQKQLQEQVERSYSDLEAKITFRTLELEHQVQELRQRLGEA